MFLLCDWRNIWHVKDEMYEYSTGIIQRAIFPASFAIASSCPRALKIGVVKRKIGSNIVDDTNNRIHDLCKYIPSMWYCLAPKACPHRVSNPLAMPSCKFKILIQSRKGLNFYGLCTLPSDSLYDVSRRSTRTYQYAIGKPQ